MKYKQKVDTIISIILIMIGACLQIFPLLKINNIKWINVIVFGSYALLNLIKYLLTIKSKDYEGLFIFIASIIALIFSLVLKAETKAFNLSLTLMIWITLVSLTRLKKADYYHDRHDRMWKLNIFFLLIFILSGLLTSINLYYEANVQILIIGSFFLINGILCLFDPIVKTLISHS